MPPTAGCRSTPVTQAVEADGMGELGKQHRGKMTQDDECPGLLGHAGFTGIVVGHSESNVVPNVVEMLLEDD